MKLLNRTDNYTYIWIGLVLPVQYSNPFVRTKAINWTMKRLLLSIWGIEKSSSTFMYKCKQQNKKRIWIDWDSAKAHHNNSGWKKSFTNTPYVNKYFSSLFHWLSIFFFFWIGTYRECQTDNKEEKIKKKIIFSSLFFEDI